jgi:hypothetical protein
MGLKGCRLWAMGQLDSTRQLDSSCSAPPRGTRPTPVGMTVYDAGMGGGRNAIRLECVEGCREGWTGQHPRTQPIRSDKNQNILAHVCPTFPKRKSLALWRTLGAWKITCPRSQDARRPSRARLSSSNRIPSARVKSSPLLSPFLSLS